MHSRLSHTSWRSSLLLLVLLDGESLGDDHCVLGFFDDEVGGVDLSAVVGGVQIRADALVHDLVLRVVARVGAAALAGGLEQLTPLKNERQFVFEILAYEHS